MNLSNEIKTRWSLIKRALTPLRHGRISLLGEAGTGDFQRDIPFPTQKEAASNSTVAACSQLIADSVSKLPLCLTQQNNKVWSPITDPAYSQLLRKPARQYDRIAFFSYLTNCLLFNGNAIGFKHRDVKGKVRDISLLDPRYVRIQVATDGSLFYRVQKDDQLATQEAIAAASALEEVAIIPAEHIVHWRVNPQLNPIIGTSRLAAAIDAAATGRAITTRQRSLHGNKPYVQGILEVPQGISPEQAQKALDAFKAAVKKGEIGAALGAGITFKPLSLDAEQAETIAALEWTNKDIARAMGVPLELIGLAPLPNSAEQLMEHFYNTTLQPIFEVIELGFDEQVLDLPDNLGVEFDIKNLLRLMPRTRAEIAKIYISAGVLAPNEARAEIGLLPVEGGDSPVMQQQNFSLAALAKRDAKDDPFAGTKMPKPKDEEDDTENEDKSLVFEDYAEVWKDGDYFQPGTSVTHDGGLWIALRATDAKPGTDDSGWKLAVKSRKVA